MTASRCRGAGPRLIIDRWAPNGRRPASLCAAAVARVFHHRTAAVVCCVAVASPRLAACPPAAVALSDLSWVRVRVGVVVLVVAAVVVLCDAHVHLRTTMSSNGDGGRLSYRMGFDRGWGDAATPVVRVQRF